MHTTTAVRARSWVLPAIQILGGSLAIALTAQIRVPLPYTPVPLIVHNMTIMLLGVLLGPRKGALAVLAYLAEVSCGLPILSGWRSVPMALLSPIGGYLMGFVVQTYLIGWLAQRLQRTWPQLLLMIGVPTLLQLLMGTLWLGLFVGPALMWAQGFVPFVAIDACKIFAVASALKVWHAARG